MYALAPDIVVAYKRLLETVLKLPKLALSVPVEILVVARRVLVVRPVLKFKVTPLTLVKTLFIIVLFAANTAAVEILVVATNVLVVKFPAKLRLPSVT